MLHSCMAIPTSSDRACKSDSPELLTSCHAALLKLSEFPPVAGLPEGRVRIRLRADEVAPVVYVRTATGIRQFLINIDLDNKLSCGPEVAANWRPVAAAAVTVEDCVYADVTAAENAAQRAANRTGVKWVWYVDRDGGAHAKPADILPLVRLQDIVLGGEIVVLERPSSEIRYNLVWPELPLRAEPAKFPM